MTISTQTFYLSLDLSLRFPALVPEIRTEDLKGRKGTSSVPTVASVRDFYGSVFVSFVAFCALPLSRLQA